LDNLIIPHLFIYCFRRGRSIGKLRRDPSNRSAFRKIFFPFVSAGAVSRVTVADTPRSSNIFCCFSTQSSALRLLPNNTSRCFLVLVPRSRFTVAKYRSAICYLYDFFAAGFFSSSSPFNAFFKSPHALRIL